VVVELVAGTLLERAALEVEVALVKLAGAPPPEVTTLVLRVKLVPGTPPEAPPEPWPSPQPNAAPATMENTANIGYRVM
jgi:hypothetical protein